MEFSYITNEDVPTTLYHYTSLDALISIVQSRCIRASSIRFLNDRSESLRLKENVVHFLERRAWSSQEGSVVQEAIGRLRPERRQSLFVASFTEKGDLLSQWRAYCPSGVGVSIGLSGKALKQQWIANPKGGQPFFVGAPIQKVKYYQPEDEDKLEHFVSDLIKLESEAKRGDADFRSLAAILQPLGPGVLTHEQSVELTRIMAEAVIKVEGDPGFNFPQPPGSNLAAWVFLLGPFIKHDAFSEECEWRKVATKDIRHMPGQRYRQGKSTLIPFVDLMLDKVMLGSECVPSEEYFINEVIVGPTPTPELTIEALNSFFASEGHPEVVIRSSRIPFKDW